MSESHPTAPADAVKPRPQPQGLGKPPRPLSPRAVAAFARIRAGCHPNSGEFGYGPHHPFQGMIWRPPRLMAYPEMKMRLSRPTKVA